MYVSARVMTVMVVGLVLATQGLAQDAGHTQPTPQPGGQGFLGGKFAPIDDQVAADLGIDVQDGVVVIEVVEDSPAQKAGLQEKDILKKIDGKEIDGVDTFRKVMGATKPGQTLKLGIVRDKQEQELSVTLGERPAGMQPQPSTKPG